MKPVEINKRTTKNEFLNKNNNKKPHRNKFEHVNNDINMSELNYPLKVRYIQSS